MSGKGSKSGLILTFVFILVLSVIGVRFLMPFLTRKVYEATLDFEVTGEVSYDGQSFYTGGAIVGSFQLKDGQTLIVDSISSPAGGGNLPYNYVFLRSQETGGIMDAVRLTVMNPSKLTASKEGTYSISLGVVKSILYDPVKSEGLWTFKIKKEISWEFF